MLSGQKRGALRAFVETFPPLKVALRINDCICWALRTILETFYGALKFLFSLALNLVNKTFAGCISIFKSPSGAGYKPLGTDRPGSKKDDPIRHKEPIPYRDQFLQRSLTYQGGLLLGSLLYAFVYYVLVKHHTFATIMVAFVLMLAYLLVLENSHSIRSILMLCLPIMFTNRGRALVFCGMLTIMVAGPMKNSQFNISELHLSLSCCKQFMIVKTDKYIDKNIIQNIVKVEDIVYKLIGHIERFAKEIKKQFEVLTKLAISVERYISAAIERLKEIVNICNTQNVYGNCVGRFREAYNNCTHQLGTSMDFLCGIVSGSEGLCGLVKLSGPICTLPREIINFIDGTIGERLRVYLQIIENEFYVDIDITHKYSYNATKTKSFKQVAGEIKFDVEKKFWYIHWVTRVFNFVSLILVVWILVTATLYHLHYLTDLKYDNMYLDGYLREIDEVRQRRWQPDNKTTTMRKSSPSTKVSKQQEAKEEMKEKMKKKRKLAAANWETLDADEQALSTDEPRASLRDDGSIVETTDDEQETLLLPITAEHEKQYLKPFSLGMNEMELSKLYVASLVWLVIVGYIFFFVLLDYALFQTIDLVDGILREILFTSDLPLVDVTSKSGDQVVHYNRTYLSQLRARHQTERLVTSAGGDRHPEQQQQTTSRNGSLSAMYRRLMDLAEADLPDDVSILDSLEQCLPKASQPNYRDYTHLVYLALFTMGAVVVEAYALRTRHCIANLYYPIRAKRRAVWFYRKLLSEKPKFEDPERLASKTSDKGLLEAGLKVLEARVKR